MMTKPFGVRGAVAMAGLVNVRDAGGEQMVSPPHRGSGSRHAVTVAVCVPGGMLARSYARARVGVGALRTGFELSMETR